MLLKRFPWSIFISGGVQGFLRGEGNRRCRRNSFDDVTRLEWNGTRSALRSSSRDPTETPKLEIEAKILTFRYCANQSFQIQKRNQVPPKSNLEFAWSSLKKNRRHQLIGPFLGSFHSQSLRSFIECLAAFQNDIFICIAQRFLVLQFSDCF